MAKPTDITRCIRLWATETGGEQMVRLGYAAIDAIRGSEAANDPDYSAPVDHINRIIERLRDNGQTKEYLVLRLHYLTPQLNEAERFKLLPRVGLTISRAAYYIYLERAHSYFAGALDFGDPPCES